MRTMRTGTRVHSHRTGAPASELRYVAAVPATSDIVRARSALARKLRDGLEQRGYLEVETPIAVPFAGQEPHLRPFETTFTPDPPIAPTGVEGARRLHLHTSPEYAMKRLLARPGFSRYAGFDPIALDAGAFTQAARACGVRPAPGASWDDLFTQVLLEKIEPALGIDRPTYLTEYPASQAALARLKPSDPRVAERFELYAGGLELANGFSELCDSREQRERLREEQELRRRLGREVFPLDEKFLSALDGIGEAGGVAVGFDRLLMLLTGAKTIADVLLFPAVDEYPAARRAP